MTEDDYEVIPLRPNAFGDVRYGVRKKGGIVCYSERSESLAREALRRFIATGKWNAPIDGEAYVAAFAARLEEDARAGFTRD